MSRVSLDINQILMLAFFGLRAFTSGILNYLLVFTVIFLLDWRLLILSIATFPLVILVVIVFPRQLHPLFFKAREEYGKLKFLSLNRFSGLPIWGQWVEKQSSFGSSGGALFDLLIHDIDYLNFVFGKPIMINSKYFPGKLSEHDYISAWWEYPGFMVKVEGGNTFHSNFPFQAGFMAEFEKASVLYSTNDPDNIQVSNQDDNKRIELEPEDGFYNEIDYFKNCIKNNSKPDLCSPESALGSIELCYQHLK